MSSFLLTSWDAIEPGWVSQSLRLRTDLTDVTLVSENWIIPDWRLYWRDSGLVLHYFCSFPRDVLYLSNIYTIWFQKASAGAVPQWGTPVWFRRYAIGLYKVWRRPGSTDWINLHLCPTSIHSSSFSLYFWVPCTACVSYRPWMMVFA